MNDRDRYPGRHRYDEPDMTSSAYLRSNASYTNFLQKQHYEEPIRDYRGSPRFPHEHPRDRGFREPPRGSWRNEPTHSPPLPYPPRPDFRDREPGWRNEPSWRAPGPLAPRAESWVERRDRIAPPPGPEAQRYIAPPEPQRRIAPPHGMPHEFQKEMWRGSPASANWRNERPGDPMPSRRRLDSPDRIIEGPVQESSPRRSPRRFSISPPRSALEAVHRQEPSVEPTKGIPKADSPIRNKILPAQQLDRPPPPLSIPDSASTTSEEHEGRSSWKHGPPRSREESWTLQYKRRVEAQKEVLKRNIGRPIEHDIPAGSSAEQYRLAERVNEDRLAREESPARKYFFAPKDANGSREDKRSDYRDRPEHSDKYKEGLEELRKYAESKTNGESTINPSDFVEPIDQFNDDDDWNALGELLNDQSRKRPRPADDIIPSPVKTAPVPVPKPAPSDHPYYRKESSRVEFPSAPQVSFFRQELPSAKSRFGILPIPEKDRAQLWEDDTQGSKPEPVARLPPRPDFGPRGAYPSEFEARRPLRPEFDKRPPPRSEYGNYLQRAAGNRFGTPRFDPPTPGYGIGHSHNEYGYR